MTSRTVESDVSTFALDVYWASGRFGDAALESHVADCDRCRTYLASLDALAETGAPLPSPTPSKSGATRRQWAAAVAGGVALAAGIALALALALRDKPMAYVGIKGTPAVQLLLHRDRNTHVWDGHSPLHPGDALALRVACEGLKRVVVATPGASGWVRLSSTGCPVNGDPLPFTLQVDDEPGNEKLAVVLSQDELDDDALQKAIAEARQTADTWVLSYVMPKETEKNR